MRKLLFPVIIGLGGLIILVALGNWQLNRLEWKRGILSQIEQRLAEDPVPLPAAVAEGTDEYRQVRVSGRPTGDEVHVLVSGTQAGTGYRVISAFVTEDGRRILVDQGFLEFEDENTPPATPPAMELLGSLLWPDDVTRATPQPDLQENIWYARDLPAMAEQLDTEEILIVMEAASVYDPRLTPLPVDTAGISNDHLQYAITWFLLAVVWFSMSLYWLIRTMRKQEGH